MDPPAYQIYPLVAPTPRVMSQIFPKETKSPFFHILRQTHKKCTVSLHYTAGSLSQYRTKALVVRLDRRVAVTQTTAALQRLAHSKIPELVPKIFAVGTCTDNHGHLLAYVVREYLQEMEQLENVWERLDDGNQDRLMDEVVSAMTRIQTLKLFDKKVQKILSGTEYLKEKPNAWTIIKSASRWMSIPRRVSRIRNRIGGPNFGYFNDMIPFLDKVNDKHLGRTASNIRMFAGGGFFSIESPNHGFPDSFSTELIGIDNLPYQSVFCHTALEPRNLRVRLVPAKNGVPEHYQLAAIMYWKGAGFYPLAYTSLLKDIQLGYPNQFFPWYRLWKQKTADLMPGGKGSESLARVIQFMTQMQDKYMSRSLRVVVRDRFREREDLKEGQGMYGGWVRGLYGVGRRPYTREDNRKLIEDVREELAASEGVA